ncbi:MAG: hypothetical protein Ct9H90mP13_00810 [Pseudomonadota bacterium]|nr:MAG: hypothetical protein Ct9H90mP13_00810 [Pseudomonadota bacterium]
MSSLSYTIKNSIPKPKASKGNCHPTKEIFGENSYRLITPLNNLGSAYYMVEKYELAKKFLKECIQLIELNRNIISPELVHLSMVLLLRSINLVNMKMP